MADFSLGVAELGTSVDTSGLKDGIGEAETAAQSGFGGIGNIMSGALTVGLTAAAGGIAALGAGLVAAVGEASEAQQGLAQLDAVLESTGGKAGVTKDQVLELASSLSASNGLSKFSDDAILAGENLLLTFTNIGQDVFPQAAQAAIDMAQAMGTDPQAQAIALGKALNDPIAGVSALSRVGVTFTDQQKELIKSLVETGDVAGAQKVILNELAGEFGGSAANAAQTFSGQLITLQEKFNGILESVGTALLPVLQELLGMLSSPEAMAQIQALADTLVNGLISAINWLATDAIPKLLEIWNQLQPAFQIVYDFISANLQPALDALVIVFGVLYAPIQALIDVSTALYTAWTTNFGGIQTSTSSAFDTIKPYFDGAMAQLTVFANEVLPLIVNAWTVMSTNIVTGATIIYNAIAANWGSIQAVIDSTMQYILAVIQAGWTLISGIVKAVLQLMSGDVQGAWSTILATITATVSNLNNVVNAGFTLLKDTVGSLLQIMLTIAMQIWNELSGQISSTVETIKTNISTAFENAKEAVISKVTDLKDGAISLWDGLKNSIDNTVTSMKDTVITGITSMKDQAIDLFNDLKDTVANLAGDFLSAAENIASSVIDGIAGGIQDGTGRVLGVLQQLAADMIDSFVDAFKIGSPSRVMYDLSSYLPQGVALGISDNAYMVTDAINQMSQGAISGSSSIINNWDINANYVNQPERALRDDVRLFQLLGETS